MAYTAEEVRKIKKMLPDDSDEAEKRFNDSRKDPFPQIEPALLNSADILEYEIKTGMIFPFYPEKLKPASYEICLLGKCIYWNAKGQKCRRIIKPGDEFILERNSIAFVTLEPMFRIPHYIALRFNLKITHIYRGLLLGTGPLVDPGFNGKLSIPLHNLTTNDYTLRGGEGLIWMEFTKISRYQEWDSTHDRQIEARHRIGKYVPFPTEKNLADVEDYLHKADPHRPKRSSLPDEIRRAVDIAKQARNRVYLITAGGLLSIAVMVFGLYHPTQSLVQDAVYYVDGAKRELSNEVDDIKKMKEEIQKLKAEIKKQQGDKKTSSKRKDAIPEK